MRGIHRHPHVAKGIGNDLSSNFAGRIRRRVHVQVQATVRKRGESGRIEECVERAVEPRFWRGEARSVHRVRKELDDHRPRGANLRGVDMSARRHESGPGDIAAHATGAKIDRQIAEARGAGSGRLGHLLLRVEWHAQDGDVVVMELSSHEARRIRGRVSIDIELAGEEAVHLRRREGRRRRRQSPEVVLRCGVRRQRHLFQDGRSTAGDAGRRHRVGRAMDVGLRRDERRPHVRLDDARRDVQRHVADALRRGRVVGPGGR